MRRLCIASESHYACTVSHPFAAKYYREFLIGRSVSEGKQLSISGWLHYYFSVTRHEDSPERPKDQGDGQ
jgi:hypothetical protein